MNAPGPARRPVVLAGPAVTAIVMATVMIAGCSSDPARQSTMTHAAAGTTAGPSAGSPLFPTGSAPTGTSPGSPSAPASSTTAGPTEPAAPTPTGSTLPGTPVIEEFTISPTEIPCDGSRPLATMSWRVTPEDAGIEFWIDGLGSGTAQAGYAGVMHDQPLPVNFACDGQRHTVTLAAHGPGDAVAQRSIEVTTRV